MDVYPILWRLKNQHHYSSTHENDIYPVTKSKLCIAQASGKQLRVALLKYKSGHVLTDIAVKRAGDQDLLIR